MTPAAVRYELAQLAQQRTRIEQRRAAAAVAIDVALAEERFEPRRLRDARQDMAELVTQLEDLDARAAALAKVLPTPETVQQAEADVAALLATAANQHAEFTVAAAAFLDALETTEQAARRLAGLRAAAVQTGYAATDVATAAGLKVTIPTPPALDWRQAGIAALQVQLAEQAIQHTPDSLLLNELAAARQVAA